MDFKFINNNSENLLIIFGTNLYNPDKFEFNNYTNRFFNENTVNKPSILFLRDRRRSWYYYGIYGFSKNYEDTIKSINKYKYDYNFKKIIKMINSKKDWKKRLR